MDPKTDHLFHLFEHLWIPISTVVGGIFATIIGAVGIAMKAHKDIRKRIENLEILAENFASRDELNELRKESDNQDNNNLDKIFKAINDNAREQRQALAEMRKEQQKEGRQNADEHQDILKHIIKLHSGDNK